MTSPHPVIVPSDITASDDRTASSSNRGARQMITTSVGHVWRRGRVAGAFGVAALAIVRVLVRRGAAHVSADRVRQALIVDPSLQFSANEVDADEWMAWCARNLNDRDLSLMLSADAADRGASGVTSSV